MAPNFGSELESPQAVVDAVTGTLTSTFVYAGEHAVMRIDAGGNPVYYLRDTMGSVLSLTDAAGSEVGEFEYDAFGNERVATGSQASLPGNLGGDFRYHGQWQERATGLYYVRARTYDPASGRFLSRDPIEGGELEPETFHSYSWNANNPWVYRDPTGLFSLIDISLARGGQSAIINIRNAIVRFAIEEVSSRARGVTGNLIAGLLKPLLPGVVSSAIEAGTQRFGEFVTDGICGAIGDSKIEDYAYFGPSIRKSGTVASDGFTCANRDDPGATSRTVGTGTPRGSQSLSRPDLFFSPVKPTEIKTTNRNRSFLIGEVKYKAKVALKNAESGSDGVVYVA